MAQPVLLSTPDGSIHGVRLQRRPVHRVGYRPDPWVWTPWTYAGADGRFRGHWEDPHETWRSLYVGSSALARYLAVLARFRTDPRIQREMDEIIDDDDHLYPTAPAGALSRRWCQPRLNACGRLSGLLAVPGHQESLPTLRQRFLGLAESFGLADLESAAIRDGRPRALTQAISAWMDTLQAADETPLSGMKFQSRHGDDLAAVT